MRESSPNHRNMIAALLVEGSTPERFGAAARGNQPFSVWPTHPNCDAHFRFDRDGTIQGTDPDGTSTVNVLRLDHETLNGWRRAALDVFLAIEVIQSREDVETLIARLDEPQNGRLTEYCFCIKSVAAAMIV